jgi:tetraacyldisaccharide 4'-kinase
MRAPAFWWRPPSLAASALRPIGLVYGAVAARRMERRGERAGVPVICVGNFTAGGAGKTPTALAVAQRLIDAGERPVFLSRGYGGRLRGPVRVDPARHGALDVGDEPLLLARIAPAIVAHDRPAGARLAVAEGASVIVMDDGLQNPSLTKDLTIAVVDGQTGVGNGLCLPAGPLRAPLSAQWPHVDAVIVVGAGAGGDAVAHETERRGKRAIRARLEPDPATTALLRGRRVLAFAGIGRPEKLFATVEACGAQIIVRRAFPDHHRFTARDVAALAVRAEADGLALVTTEKDCARIETAPALRAYASRITPVPVQLVMDDGGALERMLADRILGRSAGDYAFGPPGRS